MNDSQCNNVNYINEFKRNMMKKFEKFLATSSTFLTLYFKEAVEVGMHHKRYVGEILKR